MLKSCPWFLRFPPTQPSCRVKRQSRLLALHDEQICIERDDVCRQIMNKHTCLLLLEVHTGNATSVVQESNMLGDPKIHGYISPRPPTLAALFQITNVICSRDRPKNTVVRFLLRSLDP